MRIQQWQNLVPTAMQVSYKTLNMHDSSKAICMSLAHLARASKVAAGGIHGEAEDAKGHIDDDGMDV